MKAMLTVEETQSRIDEQETLATWNDSISADCLE